jgi:hypothetical protein
VARGASDTPGPTRRAALPVEHTRQEPQRGSRDAGRVGHSGALFGQSFPLAWARAAAALTVAHALGPQW